MTNIKDVAKKAKVSVATVSHVINNSQYVSDKLKKKVLKAIENLDYQPNILAGSLRSKRTGTIGLIIPDSSNMLYASMGKRIEDILFSLNYNTIFCNTDYNTHKELAIINNMRSKNVDGVLIVPVDRNNININKFVQSRIPTIILDRKISGNELITITVENEVGVYEATKYLLDLGHRNIGYIDRNTPHSHSIERLKGYKNALENFGLKVSDNLVAKSGFSFENGYFTMGTLLKNNPELTALITFNYTAAIGATRAIADAKLKIPNDISVIGFDDVPLCQYSIPRLTSIHYPIEEIAEVATKTLLGLIKKNIYPSLKDIIIPTKLILRESTGPVNKKRSKNIFNE
ncbi:MAG: LacI family DNA-binding transcriptional regulator [Candidatus Humimicrobiaceae bacterium]